MPRRLEYPEGVVRVRGSKRMIRKISLLRSADNIMIWEIETRVRAVEHSGGTLLEHGDPIQFISISPPYDYVDPNGPHGFVADIYFDRKYGSWASVVEKTGKHTVTVCLFRRP